MKPRSILFISTMAGDPWGGSEEFWFRMAIYMSKNGYQVGCSFFEWPSGKEEKIKMLHQTGCRLYPIPHPKTARNFLHKISLRKKGYRILKEICDQDWSVTCISQGGYEDVTHRPFRFLYRSLSKFVLINHNYNESHRLSASRTRNLATWVNKATLNMGAAARIFEVIHIISGITVPRQHILNNPLTIPYQPLPIPWPTIDEKGRYVLTMLAHLDIARKAQDILIKALSIQKWKTRNWILYLYGNGKDMKLLKELIHENGMEEQIKLMGHTGNVSEVLQKTHLLLQVTHIDAMPLSVTEAMNMARPCLVSQTGDMPRWITDGKNGYIAPSVTISGMDSALERAWENRDNWEQMGREAHSVFVKKYPQPYEEYYTGLLVNL